MAVGFKTTEIERLMLIEDNSPSAFPPDILFPKALHDEE